jgi:N-6 DNA Methylase
MMATPQLSDGEDSRLTNPAPTVTPPVTLSQIAELAGVRPSAVSNWRKRFTDFPDPVGSATGGRDLFSLTAVEAWLADHNRLSDAKKGERFLFEAADILRSELDVRGITEVLCAALTLAYTVPDHEALVDDDLRRTIGRSERDDPSLVGVFASLEALAPITRKRLLELVIQLDPVVVPDLFDWALARYPRFVQTRTSDRLTELLVKLSFGESSGRIGTLFDPAVGQGNLLLAAARAKGSRLDAFGQDLDEGALRIAKQRFRLRCYDATLSPGNSLLHDAFPDLNADVVLCDPPYGVKVDFPAESMADPRWRFGQPTADTGDYAWLQHVIHHLTPDGRGYILLPANTLVRRGRGAEIRAQLLRRGAVEAIVALPPRAAEHTAIPLALWVVRPTTDNREPTPILIVDGTGAAGKPSEPLDLPLIDRIAQTMRTWRARAEVRDSDHGFAAVVPVIEILGPNSNLNPARWVNHESTLNVSQRRRAFEQAVQTVRSAREKLSTNEIDTRKLRGNPESLTWVSMSDLVSDGRAEVIRGLRVGSEDHRQEGTPLLRVGDLRTDDGHMKETLFVDVKTLRHPPKLTRPGDILISPVGDRVRAMVDEHGGCVLASPLQALRLHGNWMNPNVAAAFLESGRNRRLVGAATSVVAHVDIREFQLPIIPLSEAAELEMVLEQLDASEVLAHDIATASRAARDALLDLGGYASGTDASSSSRHDDRDDR